MAFRVSNAYLKNCGYCYIPNRYKIQAVQTPAQESQVLQ